MKKNLLLIGFILCFSLTTCRKKQEAVLPPETTIGAMSFGCKINGKVFVPKDGRGKPGLYVQYVYLDGGWYLNIPAVNWKDRPLEAVSLTTDSMQISENQTFPIGNSKGGFRAFYAHLGKYVKLNNDEGEVTIKKFDPVNRILSGTFFFTGTHESTGEKVEVTEGRFDVRF